MDEVYLEVLLMVRLFALFVLFVFSMASTATAGSVPVQIAWDAPHNPELVVGYRVHIGTTPGNYSSTIEVGKNMSYSFSSGVVGVRYYFAVSAYNAAGNGPLAPEVSSVVLSDGTSVPTPTPDPQTGGVVLDQPVVKGSSVTLSWSAGHNKKIAEYTLEAGTRPGLSDVFNGPVGQSTRVTGNVGNGTFFVRVRGLTTADETLTSNEVTFTVGGSDQTCTAPPPAPARPTGGIKNGLATLSWTAVPGATSYVVQAGSSSGLSDVFYGDVGPYSSVSAEVPETFRAWARVIAVNGCGKSIASPETTIR